MVEIQNNMPATSDNNSAGLIVGVLVILVVGLIFYFGYWRGRAPAASPSSGVNVQLNTGGASPAGSSGSSGGAGY